MKSGPAITVLLCAVFVLTGCGAKQPVEETPPTHRPPVKAEAPPKNYDVVPVFYGTDRAVADANSKEDRYASDRGDGTIQYGKAEVSIPKKRELGTVPRPVWWKGELREDPEKHVVILTLDSGETESTFYEHLAATVASSKEKAALVFVHGYNVTFADALRRTAQIAHDIEYDGVPILYSWPSRGAPQWYVADEEAVEWTIPHLERFLADVVARTGVRRVHVLAHSMGNRALGHAFARLAARRDPRLAGVIRDVVLAAPDIDAGTFQEQVLPALVEAGVRVTLYVSSNDRALQTSRQICHCVRLGEAARVFAGVHTVDASNVDTDFLGHSYFAESYKLITDVSALIRYGLDPSHRVLIETVEGPVGSYWKFKE